MIQTLEEKTGESLAWVKRLVKIGSVKVIAEQHNPSKKVEFPAKTVKAVHRILTVEDLISI